MRTSPRRLATMVVALLVAGCSTAPSLAPITTPPPSGPAATPPLPTTPAPTSSPQPISLATGQIAAGYLHTCVITSGGGVTCWGADSIPVGVPGLAGGVRAITAGGSHTCVLTSGGGVKCWGSNEYGQLGDGSKRGRSAPVDVSGLSSGVTAISAGWSHTCALTTGGGVKCWGENFNGGLGDGTTTDSDVPVNVSGLASGVSAIAAGGGHTCAVKVTGRVTCWGDGMAADPNEFHTKVPVDIAGLDTGFTEITATNDRTCALTNRGGVTCWGPNYGPPPGQTLPPRIVPLDLSSFGGGVEAIAIGETNFCALTTAGGVACWNAITVPVVVPGLEGATAIAVGGSHACALRSGGGVKCWGGNGAGQLGSVIRCSTTSIPVDVPIDGVPLPAPTSAPGIPIGRIDHPTGPKDVVLRANYGPDLSVGELDGVTFQPGPEFSLYGDGTVIFRHLAQPPPAKGPIVRAAPFSITHLDDSQMQSLLRFALGEGGLWDACEEYPTQDVDGSGFSLINVHAGGLDKRVLVVGPSPLGALMDRLFDFDPGAGVSTEVWVPERYWGNLFPAASAIEIGLLPDPNVAGSFPWPWPNIAPAEFSMRAEYSAERRVMSAAEAAVHGFSGNGGVVSRVYLVGPDGSTIYSFSLWPMLPDDGS